MEPGSTQPQEKLWCAYCGKEGDGKHQSGHCVRLLRDREQALNHRVNELLDERKRIIELALGLVWELQHLCKKPIHFDQEKELLDLRDK